MPAQKIGDVSELIVQHIQLVRDVLNFSLRAAINLVVQLAANAIFQVLPILAHHDDRRLNRGQHRQEQIQQDEWIRIPSGSSQDDVGGDIRDEHRKADNDERPRAAEVSHGVGDAVAKGQVLFNDLVRIAAGADTHKLL